MVDERRIPLLEAVAGLAPPPLTLLSRPQAADALDAYENARVRARPRCLYFLTAAVLGKEHGSYSDVI